MVKKLTKNEYNNLKTLVKDTFNACVANDFTEDGKNEFYRFIENDENLDGLDIFGYYIEDKLIGVIAGKDELSHISLFFVDKALQKHSFGKKLMETFIDNSKAEVITVHAAPGSIYAYKHMGFIQTDKAVEENGMKYVPMELRVDRNKKDEESYTMAELLAQENLQIKKDKEEKERLAIEHEEILKLENARHHQEYLEMKEKKHQEYIEMKEKKHLEWLAEKERRANTFEDKILTCKKCGREWIWTAKEQKFFKEKGFFRPSMCKECRANIKTINNFHK